MAEHMSPHGHMTGGMSVEDARRRLHELREREKTGKLTVHDAGEITRMLIILGEHEMERGERAA